jgi:integrase
MGKRDYTMILFAVRYGIRSCDISNLKLSDIDWDNWQIEFRQLKTGGLLRLPLLEDIAQSLMDYYKYGRPKTACQNIFIRHCAPYNDIPCISYLGKYFSRAGIDVSGRKHGLHSLRHTLASRLLEENVDLLTIADILGHLDIHTTNDYLHIDIENLKKCALDPEEVHK